MIPRPNVMRKNLQTAQELSDDNGGRLPNPWRMIQMGYGGLYRYIIRHPSAFKSFKFDPAVGIDKKGRKPFNVAIREEHIDTAKQLIKKKGRIPDPAWLNANGYSRLAAYMRTYPGVIKKLV